MARLAIRLVVGRFFLAILVSSALTACVPNSSNPSVGITRAQLGDTDAVLSLRLVNPSGRNLTLTRLDYELSEGATGLPLASSAWEGVMSLPARGEATMPLNIVLDAAPLDATSSLLRLSGQLHFRDDTGFLGMQSLDLTGSAFSAEVVAERAGQ
jgi:hypothetical protein